MYMSRVVWLSPSGSGTQGVRAGGQRVWPGCSVLVWGSGGVFTSSIAGRSDGVGLQHSESSCERAAGHALLKG